MVRCSSQASPWPESAWSGSRKEEQSWDLLAAFPVRRLADQYESAEKITLVMDNLNTHCAGIGCTRHLPRTRPRRYGIASISVYTPKHGSWLNVAEIELNVLSSSTQCLELLETRST